MCPRPTPTSPLSQSFLVAREITREAAECACDAAAETCAASKRIVAESKAAREARHSQGTAEPLDEDHPHGSD
jgi:hypothetical protein